MNALSISWRSMRQSIIALLSMETDFVALSTAAEEIVWICRLCWEIKFNQSFMEQALILTIKVFSDNSVAIAITHQHH